MTTQDLIIGHYEGTLTRAEQAKLDGLLASSPETRTLFEQHGMMEEKMKEESEDLAPPFGLREATLGAALGTAASTIGGGIATWLTGKFVIAVSTVVIGGAAVGLGVALSGDDEPATKNPTSAVTTGMEEGSEELISVPDTEEMTSEERNSTSALPGTSVSSVKQSSGTGLQTGTNTTGSTARADQRQGREKQTMDMQFDEPPAVITQKNPIVQQQDSSKQ